MARLPVSQHVFPWNDADECPCRSGNRYRLCCKVGPKQLPYVQIPDLRPPGAITGYAHPNCYMSTTGNCSEAISREHYISEGILKRFDVTNVSGMPWQDKGTSKALPTKALAANILCKRHNAALSPLDVLGLRAFDALIWAADYAANQQHPGRARHYLISGEGLELWMFKLAAGVHFGGIAAAEGEILRDTRSFPTAELIHALTTGELPPTSCFWITQDVGVVPRSQIGVQPLIAITADQSIGIRVNFGPLQFESTLVAPPISAKHFDDLGVRFRPGVIDFTGPARDARVVLTRKGWRDTVRRVGVELGRPQPEDLLAAAVDRVSGEACT